VEAFGGRVEFDVVVLPYEGDDGCIESTIVGLNAWAVQKGRSRPEIVSFAVMRKRENL
jgi:hypothetical protein